MVFWFLGRNYFVLDCNPRASQLVDGCKILWINSQLSRWQSMTMLIEKLSHQQSEQNFPAIRTKLYGTMMWIMCPSPPTLCFRATTSSPLPFECVDNIIPDNSFICQRIVGLSKAEKSGRTIIIFSHDKDYFRMRHRTRNFHSNAIVLVLPLSQQSVCVRGWCLT